VITTGTIRHLTIEGGAWGIETEDGEQLLPVNLDSGHRIDGLKVQFRFEPVSMLGVGQWGRAVRVHDMRTVDR
jgi:hypothetical protein